MDKEIQHRRRSLEQDRFLTPDNSISTTDGDGQESNAHAQALAHALASSVTLPRPPRLRSRTSTVSRAYSPDLVSLPTVMSRESSLEEREAHDQAGPSTYMQLSSSSKSPQAHPPSPSKTGRKSSKSVSYTRPKLSITNASSNQRSLSQYPSFVPTSQRLPIPQRQNLLPSPEVSSYSGMKRRISTPSIITTFQPDGGLPIEGGQEDATLRKQAQSRARSTSTSFVIPEALENPSPTLATPGLSTYEPDRSNSTGNPDLPSTPPQWGMYVTPASPENADDSTPPPRGMLAAAYDIGQASVSRLMSLVRQGESTLRRREYEDSEKALETGEEDSSLDTVASTASHLSFEQGQRGRYWGLWGSSSDDEAPDGGYFSMPPTPPPEGDSKRNSLGDFRAALLASGRTTSLPTPALSSTSLSGGGVQKGYRRSQRRDGLAYGWWKTVYDAWARYTPGKTAEVLKELGWTVGMLVGLFFVTLGGVIWLISGMPITTLKHLPSSTTDLQLLSAEIRVYMASSDVGWWHTIGVLTFVGCWKHAWSVPGAVVLNILVGSLLEPMPALALLTIITATGSLASYSLSRPLAPLIAVLFPKPLALVRAALAPDSMPSSSSSTLRSGGDDLVTPIQISSDPSSPPIGGPQAKANVWRRLLIMRAMGFVPWSGMNVACGVVGVDWKTFWLTTAVGSASWSYVTASVGNILSRLAVTSSTTTLSMEGNEEMLGGESLTSLLRDPILIAKLILLSLLTLIPVLLKRRTSSSSSSSGDNSSSHMSTRSSIDEALPAPLSNPTIDAIKGQPSPPLSPLAQSLARFTPVPAVFDLLSFGRMTMRTSGRIVMGSMRNVAVGAGRIVNGVIGR
ncbi:hypothetical protein BCR39DRAFT_513720 [Naematelia encephala]|uniref:Uncharacterized protein n=1 Tax=Naematelia encephala TaxID=71784 RepID=A0A1Y2BKL4_9TREE|nr:hypothetical protein BCR39DRAFT_513720 [Naematelia encephala]